MGPDLVLLLALLGVLVEHFAEVVPSALRDEDGIAKVAFDLADGDVAALSVLFAREEKVFVLDTNVSRLRGLRGSLCLAVVVLLNEFLEVVVELLHAIGWNEDLKARVAARKSLGDFQETAPCVFLCKRKLS